jgi:RimJ/RimL family protein N-acetyltransferase
MAFPERLTTERLVLRRWSEADLPGLVAVLSQPAVWTALWPGREPDAAFAAKRIEHHVRHWSEHGFGLLIVEVGAPSAEIAGWAGPSHPDFAPGLETEVEIGWTLAPAHWGRGLATEAARAAIAATFAALDVERVISLVHPENHRSRGVARRLGMERVDQVQAGDLPLEVHELRRPDVSAAT